MGRLYHLITWQGGFNFGPGPVYVGMDKNSQWVELLYWIYAPTLFIRRRLGPLLLGLHFRPVQVRFFWAEASLGSAAASTWLVGEGLI